MTLEEMKKRILLMVLTALLLGVSPLAAQGLKRVYNEQADAALQIDSALTVARDAGKLVVCQVGGNWCPWCLKFADFITSDNEIAQLVEKNFVYIHVNYAQGRGHPPGDAAAWQSPAFRLPRAGGAATGRVGGPYSGQQFSGTGQELRPKQGVALLQMLDTCGRGHQLRT